MSINNYYKFSKSLNDNGFENVFTIKESLLIAEDISLMEIVPERIMDELQESYGNDAQKVANIIKETFKGVFDDTIDEGMRPKKLTGLAKVARDEKSHLMSLGNKDPEIVSIKEIAKKKIIQKLKQLGKQNGIQINKINFDKIKL